MDIDPITLEVLRNKLDGIANEMQLTLVRSAFSAIVKEGLDASASLFTLQGETLAQALAIPVHLGALTPMVGRLLHDVPLDADGRGRHLDPQRHLSRRHASAGHRHHDAGVRRRPCDRDQRGDDASPGCRRHGAGLHADQRDRDLPGRHPHPAAAIPPRRCAERHADRDAAAECASAGCADGRHQRTGRRLHDRRATTWRARRQLRPTTNCWRCSTNC